MSNPLATVTKVNQVGSKIVRFTLPVYKQARLPITGMESSLKALSRRERRRRQNEENFESEGSEDIIVEQNKIAERDSKSVDQNSRILVRRETFTVLKPRNAFENSFSIEKDDETDKNSLAGNELNPQNDSSDSKNLTHTINVETWKTESENLTYGVNNEDFLSKHDTYSVRKTESDRPVPAPRRRQTISTKEPDRNSSDTDKDVMEIEPDERNASNRTDSAEKKPEALPRTSKFESDTSVEEPPKPKPRKLSSLSTAFPRTESISKSKSLEEITVKVVSPRSTKSDPETKRIDCGKPEIEEESKMADERDDKRRTKRFAALIRRRKERKASRMFSSVMKMEKARIPTISSILRELKEDSTKEKLEEENEIDFEINSPRLPQSAPNEKMYVQCKNGFYLTNREDFFKGEDDFRTGNGEGGRMEDSTTSNMLKTGMFFQKYWSRSMIYVHGVLAGLGFGHAFAVSAILYYIDESEKFIDVYSSLSLKIHFLFYALISLSVISCLDRLDVGRTSKKHWRGICLNSPISWFVLVIYATSLSLNFANHNSEFKFDCRQHRNETGGKLSSPEVDEHVTETFSSWYRIVWARDVMVLAGWLLISLTDYPDNLYLYVRDLALHSGDGKLVGQ